MTRYDFNKLREDEDRLINFLKEKNATKDEPFHLWNEDEMDFIGETHNLYIYPDNLIDLGITKNDYYLSFRPTRLYLNDKDEIMADMQCFTLDDDDFYELEDDINLSLVILDKSAFVEKFFRLLE